MLKHSFKYLCLAAILSASPQILLASHHFETALSKQYPEYDLTDLFVFESAQPDRTVFIMDINPKTKDNGQPAFGDKGVYSFHIATNREMTGTGLTITAHMEGDDFIIGLTEGANQAVGTKGTEVGRATIGTDQMLDNGMRIWSGAAKDPFVGNSLGIREFRKNLSAGKLDMGVYDNGDDFFGKLFSSIIVIEVPNTLLPPEIAVYASSAMYNIDKWEQVNRLANPLVTHLFMYENRPEVREHVGHRPDTDAGRRYAISNTVLRAIALDGKIAEPVAYADEVAQRMLPDMISYKVGSTAAYTMEKMNGRKTTDDAMDTVMSVFLGRPVTDHANTFDHHPKTFPYVVPVGKK